LVPADIEETGREGDAARLASENQAAKVELENARLVNKAKFRP
jgi:hypothetical protein